MQKLEAVVSRDLKTGKEKLLLVVDGTNYNTGNIPEYVLEDLVNKVGPVLDIYDVGSFVSAAKRNKKTVNAVGSRLHGGFTCTLNGSFTAGISGLLPTPFGSGDKISYACPLHESPDNKLTRLEHLEVAMGAFERRNNDVRELFITNDEVKKRNEELRDELKEAKKKLKEASVGTGEERQMVVGVGSTHYQVTKREFDIITKILGKVEKTK